MDSKSGSSIHTPFGSYEEEHSVHNDTIHTTRIGIERDSDKFIDAVASMKAYCASCYNNRSGNCAICKLPKRISDLTDGLSDIDKVRIDSETYKKLQSYKITVRPRFIHYIGMLALLLALIMLPFIIIIGVY